MPIFLLDEHFRESTLRKTLGEAFKRVSEREREREEGRERRDKISFLPIQKTAFLREETGKHKTSARFNRYFINQIQRRQRNALLRFIANKRISLSTDVFPYRRERDLEIRRRVVSP